jgi:hypothetical protein
LPHIPSHLQLRRGPALLALLVIVALAAALRFRAAMDDLWLDELISLSFAFHCHSIRDIFTTFLVDNNNPLNTFYLYMQGERFPSPLRARMMSILFGIASVPVAYWVGRHRPRSLRLLFALLLAVNDPLIHFSSEARGYSGAIFAGLLAYGAVVRFVARPRFRWVALAFLAVFVGGLSHLTFGIVWVLLVIWSLVLLLRRFRIPTALRLCTYLHAPALLVWIPLYFGFVRHLSIPGSPTNTPASQVRLLLALTLGWPFHAGWNILAIIAALLAVSAWFVVARRRSGHLEWLFHALVIILPMVGVLFLPPTYVFARHLLFTVPFLLQWLAILAVRLSRTPPCALFAGTLVLLYLLGQSVLISRFFKVGRGNISGAVAYILAHDPSPVIVISSDHYAREVMEFPYMESLLPPDRILQSTPVPGAPRGPNWFVVHREGGDPPGPAATVSQLGDRYVRVAVFPCSLLSGQAWNLYQREIPLAPLTSFGAPPGPTAPVPPAEPSSRPAP